MLSFSKDNTVSYKDPFSKWSISAIGVLLEEIDKANEKRLNKARKELRKRKHK